MHEFKHPKYYAELRKRARAQALKQDKLDERHKPSSLPSRDQASSPSSQAPGSGIQGTSESAQAPGYKQQG